MRYPSSRPRYQFSCQGNCSRITGHDRRNAKTCFLKEECELSFALNRSVPICFIVLVLSACSPKKIYVGDIKNHKDAAILKNSSKSLSNCSVLTAPTYPLLSRLFKEEGKVILRLELDKRGRISAANVVSSSGSARLDDAAIEAAKTWRCDPVERNGQPVPAIALQPFNFVLQ